MENKNQASYERSQSAREKTTSPRKKKTSPRRKETLPRMAKTSSTQVARSSSQRGRSLSSDSPRGRSASGKRRQTPSKAGQMSQGKGRYSSQSPRARGGRVKGAVLKDMTSASNECEILPRVDHLSDKSLDNLRKAIGLPNGMKRAELEKMVLENFHRLPLLGDEEDSRNSSIIMPRVDHLSDESLENLKKRIGLPTCNGIIRTELEKMVRENFHKIPLPRDKENIIVTFVKKWYNSKRDSSTDSADETEDEDDGESEETTL